MISKKLLSTLLISAALCSPMACAADRESISKTTQDGSKPSASTYLATTDAQLSTRLKIDPRTGEVIKIQDTKPSGDGSGSAPPPPPQEAPEPPKPYDFFDAENQSLLSLNSYFLSQLSMGVYSTALNDEDFKQDLVDKFSPQGIPSYRIDVKMESSLGAELAVFRIGDAAVIAFRGTSGEGTTNPDADLNVDLLDVPIEVEVAGKKVRIHQGFWDSTDLVYDWVFEQALMHHIAGRRIYLTGHSLGAARATVAAFRLHYEDGIPIHSLQTFGSPRVGNVDFKTAFADVGADGIKLAEVTERFVVLGDPATTFPDKEVIGFNWNGPIVIYYEHVGNTHNILPYNNGSTFDVGFDTGEIFFVPTASQWIGFGTGAGHSEHMWYDDALLEEVVNDEQYIEIKDLLMDHESVVQTTIGE